MRLKILICLGTVYVSPFVKCHTCPMAIFSTIIFSFYVLHRNDIDSLSYNLQIVCLCGHFSFNIVWHSFFFTANI